MCWLEMPAMFLDIWVLNYPVGDTVGAGLEGVALLQKVMSQGPGLESLKIRFHFRCAVCFLFVTWDVCPQRSLLPLLAACCHSTCSRRSVSSIGSVPQASDLVGHGWEIVAHGPGPHLAVFWATNGPPVLKVMGSSYHDDPPINPPFSKLPWMCLLPPTSEK